MTGTLSYRPEETGGRQRAKSLDTDTGDWTTDIAFYRDQKTARWWSVCTTPYESRFGLSIDSHRILIWRERKAAIIPRNIIERDRYGGRGVPLLVEEASCLRRYGSAVPFHDDNVPMSSHSSCRTALERRLAARTLPPVTIRASIGAARRMGSNASTTH
ncbi:hypothetical protein TNCV_1244561 [Trichonephila clavipes]|nr:hypothetical protein TNCV_1244561 [Trichonephila clavipes]